MVPGTYGGVMGGGLSSLSAFSTTTSTAATIAWPAGIRAGDLAVLIDLATALSTPTAIIPAGFSATVNNAGAILARLIVSWKVLTGAETGTITGMSSTQGAKLLYIFRGDAPITVVTPSTWNAEGTVNDPAPQTVAAASAPSSPLVIGVAYGSDGGATFSTETPAFTAKTSFGAFSAIGGYRFYSGSGVDHLVDMNDINTNILASGYLALSP